MLRRGLLKVCNELRQRVDNALPPHHRIVATRPGFNFEELIIEGPDMPEMASDTLVPIAIDMVFSTDHRGISRAHWVHDPAKEWEVP